MVVILGSCRDALTWLSSAVCDGLVGAEATCLTSWIARPLDEKPGPALEPPLSPDSVVEEGRRVMNNGVRGDSQRPVLLDPVRRHDRQPSIRLEPDAHARRRLDPVRDGVLRVTVRRVDVGHVHTLLV